MTYLSRGEEMLNPDFCREKEAEYYAKAKASTDRLVKSAYEAAAREYAYRVKQIASKEIVQF